MTEPFATPPPLSDDFATRTHHRATQLRQRRRASVVGVAALLLLLAGIAYSATGGAKQPDAQVHVAGSKTLDGEVSVGGASSTSGVSTTRPAHTGVTPTTTSAASGASSSLPATPGIAGPPSVPDPSSTAPSTTSACPAAGVVSYRPSVTATSVGSGRWHVTGTMTIDNRSGSAVTTQGWVYLAGTTVPGADSEAFLGWGGDVTVFIGSGTAFGGFARIPANQTTVLQLSQELFLDAGANALRAGSVPPTVISQGRVLDSGSSSLMVPDDCPAPTDDVPFPDAAPFPPITQLMSGTTTTSVP